LQENEFARLAVEALLKQQCRKIGWWTYQFAAYPLENMREVQAFRQLLQHHQQPLYPQAIRTPHLPNPQVPPSFQEQGYLLAKEVFEGPADTWPDGVIIADDMMTDGALVAFDELGLCVGRDLQVVTHANAGSPILFGRTKHMTVIEYDSALIAKTLFSALDLLMAGQRPEDLHMTIPPRLLPRPCP
jgi:DNA-binding LacI/PurR family transcriptional regulator